MNYRDLIKQGIKRPTVKPSPDNVIWLIRHWCSACSKYKEGLCKTLVAEQKRHGRTGAWREPSQQEIKVVCTEFVQKSRFPKDERQEEMFNE